MLNWPQLCFQCDSFDMLLFLRVSLSFNASTCTKGLEMTWFVVSQWGHSSISHSDKSSDLWKRWDRSWTLFLHMRGHPWVWLKVQSMHTAGGLPVWVHLAFVPPLSCLIRRMSRLAPLALVLLLLGLSIHSGLGQDAGNPAAATAQPPPPSGAASDGTQEDDESWGVNSLRGGFEAVSGYFDSMLEFMGGRDGVCQYRCRFGESARGLWYWTQSWDSTSYGPIKEPQWTRSFWCVRSFFGL